MIYKTYDHLMRISAITLSNLSTITDLLERSSDKEKIIEVRKALMDILIEISDRNELEKVKKSIKDVN